MKKWALRIAALFLVLFLIFSAYFLWWGQHALPMGAAYSAKVLAGGVFVAGRPPASVVAEELGFIPRLSYVVDHDEKRVTATMFGRAEATAIYREGLGTTVINSAESEILEDAFKIPRLPSSHKSKPWPDGDEGIGGSIPEDINSKQLDAAVDYIFAEPNPWHAKRTRAVIICYKGNVIAERYASGYDKDTLFAGWSMTKSVTNALVGILVQQGKLDIMQPAPVPEWRNESDPRHALTTDMLMRMSSGLRFNENYFSPFADASPMLFLRPGAGDYALTLPLDFPPDTHWSYASGTTNILCRIIKNVIADDASYHRFPYNELFNKIGMRDAVMEADNTGTFVGSSFMFATARDWTRFGLLFANDGVWNGERILPEGWVAYSGKATPTAAKGQYGAQWWRFSTDEYALAESLGKPIPEDAFYASGYEGQKVVVIPSKQLVVTRLGLTRYSRYPFTEHLVEILKALPE